MSSDLPCKFYHIASHLPDNFNSRTFFVAISRVTPSVVFRVMLPPSLGLLLVYRYQQEHIVTKKGRGACQMDVSRRDAWLPW